MFKTRLISGIVLVLIALLTIITGGWVLWGTLLALSLIGVFELYRAVGLWKKENRSLTYTGLAGVVFYYLLLGFKADAYTMTGLILVLVVIMAVYVFSYPKYHAEQIMAAFFGIIYVAVMLSYVYQTRNVQDGVFLVWLIFLCSWGCDTCAYCVGMLIGKHKMSPKLSPKKSVEGAIGGVAGAAILGAVYAAAMGGHLEGSGNKVLIYALICAVGALISMVGDLAASAIKRNHDIKDYGKLIPGHGGVLDRFDSVIFTAPVISFLALLFAA